MHISFSVVKGACYVFVSVTKYQSAILLTGAYTLWARLQPIKLSTTEIHRFSMPAGHLQLLISVCRCLHL